MSFVKTILRIFFVGFTSYAILSGIAYFVPINPSIRRSVFLAAIIVAAGHRRDDEKGGGKG